MNFHVSSCRMMTSVMRKAYINSADLFLSASASLPQKKIAFCLYIYINFSSALCISVCRNNSQLEELWVSASFRTSSKIDLLWWEKDVQSGIFDLCPRFVVPWQSVGPASNWPLPNITRGICMALYHQENPIQETSNSSSNSQQKHSLAHVPQSLPAHLHSVIPIKVTAVVNSFIFPLCKDGFITVFHS